MTIHLMFVLGKPLSHIESGTPDTRQLIGSPQKLHPEDDAKNEKVFMEKQKKREFLDYIKLETEFWLTIP